MFASNVTGLNIDDVKVFDIAPSSSACSAGTSGVNVGVYIQNSDLVNAGRVVVNQTRAQGAGECGFRALDVTRATFDRILVTGIGSNGSGIRLEASGAGTSDKVSLTNSMADGNGTNFDYAGGTPPGSFITNLTRNGNINDNLAILGGTGSRILDTFAASGPTGTINQSSFAFVTVTWLPNPSGPPGTLPGTNYAPTCTVQDTTIPSANTLRVHHIESATTTRVTARVVNDDTVAGHNGILHCLAVFRCGLADGSPCPTQ